MSESLQMWVISGASGVAILLLSAIWAQLKEMNTELRAVTISQAKYDSRLEGIEKTMEKLPCVFLNHCPNGGSNERSIR